MTGGDRMERCEKCGSAHTVEIRFSSNGGIVAIPAIQKNKLFPTYSKLSGIACTDCGTVFRLQLVNPEKLKPFATG